MKIHQASTNFPQVQCLESDYDTWAWKPFAHGPGLSSRSPHPSHPHPTPPIRTPTPPTPTSAPGIEAISGFIRLIIQMSTRKGQLRADLGGDEREMLPGWHRAKVRHKGDPVSPPEEVLPPLGTGWGLGLPFGCLRDSIAVYFSPLYFLSRIKCCSCNSQLLRPWEPEAYSLFLALVKRASVFHKFLRIDASTAM